MALMRRWACSWFRERDGGRSSAKNCWCRCVSGLGVDGFWRDRATLLVMLSSSRAHCTKRHPVMVATRGWASGPSLRPPAPASITRQEGGCDRCTPRCLLDMPGPHQTHKSSDMSASELVHMPASTRISVHAPPTRVDRRLPVMSAVPRFVCTLACVPRPACPEHSVHRHCPDVPGSGQWRWAACCSAISKVCTAPVSDVNIYAAAEA
jgi:hypothetical protein